MLHNFFRLFWVLSLVCLCSQSFVACGLRKEGTGASTSEGAGRPKGNGDGYGGTDEIFDILRTDFVAIDAAAEMIEQRIKLDRLAQHINCDNTDQVCETLISRSDEDRQWVADTLIKWASETRKLAQRDPKEFVEIVNGPLHNVNAPAETKLGPDGKIRVRDTMLAKSSYARRAILVHEFFHKLPVKGHPSDSELIGPELKVADAFTFLGVALVDYGLRNQGYEMMVQRQDPLVYWRMGETREASSSPLKDSSHHRHANDKLSISVMEHGSYGTRARTYLPSFEAGQAGALQNDEDKALACNTGNLATNLPEGSLTSSSYWVEFWVYLPPAPAPSQYRYVQVGPALWTWLGSYIREGEGDGVFPNNISHSQSAPAMSVSLGDNLHLRFVEGAHITFQTGTPSDPDRVNFSAGEKLLGTWNRQDFFESRTWHHVAARFWDDPTGANAKLPELYLDGRKQSLSAANGGLAAGTRVGHALRLRCRGALHSQETTVPGENAVTTLAPSWRPILIDEFALYHGDSMNATRVKQHYDRGVSR